MIGKIKAGLAVMQKGKAVADPAAWKAHQITANALGAAILAVVGAAKAFFGVDIPLSNEDALILAGGVIAVFNVLYTVATSKTVGL